MNEMKHRIFSTLCILMFYSLLSYSQNLLKECGCHKNINTPVTKETIRGSVHENLLCKDCHNNVPDSHPSVKPLQAECTICHGEESKELKEGSHTSKKGAPSCSFCHGNHKIEPLNSPGSITDGFAQIKLCSSCHLKLNLPSGINGKTWIMDYENSVHGKGVIKMGLNIAPSCSKCHGSHKVHNLKSDRNIVAKKVIIELCGACHKPVYLKFIEGIHYKALMRGVADVPACTDCHGEHMIVGPDIRGSNVAPEAIPATCGKCHSDRELMANYGIPPDRLSTFMGSYHGIALESGDIKAANCASCHGAHDILPASDPASMVYPANLQKTCGRCHPKASKGFKNVRFHISVNPKEASGAWVVRWFYIVFICFLMLGFILHISAELINEIRLRRNKNRSEGRK